MVVVARSGPPVHPCGAEAAQQTDREELGRSLRAALIDCHRAFACGRRLSVVVNPGLLYPVDDLQNRIPWAQPFPPPPSRGSSGIAVLTKGIGIVSIGSPTTTTTVDGGKLPG